MKRSTLVWVALLSVLPAMAVWGQDSLNVRRVGSLLNLWDAASNVIAKDSIVLVFTGRTGVRFVDVSNPDEPREVGFLNTPGIPVNAALQGEYAFIADEDSGICIANISDPSNPSVVAQYQTENAATDIAIAGQLLLVAEYSVGLLILDISDPESPQYLALNSAPQYACALAVQGQFAYVLDKYSGLYIVDLETPNNPVSRGHFIIQSGVDIAVSGNLAGVAAGNVYIIDVSDPDEPYRTGICELYRDSYRLHMTEQFVYATQVAVAHNDLYVFDISDPESPEFLGIRSVPTPRDFALTEHFIHIACAKSGLLTVQLMDDGRPSGNDYGRLIPSRIESVTLAENIAYLGISPKVLMLMDLTNPENPIEIDSTMLDRGRYDIREIKAKDHLLFLACGRQFRICDISNVRVPVEAGILDIPGFIYDFDTEGSRVYLGTQDHGIQIVDYTDPENLDVVGNYGDRSDFRGVFIRDSKLFLTDDRSFLRIIDLSDPENLQELGSLRLGGSLGKLALSGNFAFVTEYYGKNYWVVDISIQEALNLAFKGELPDNPDDVIADGNNIIIADTYNGLRIFDIANPFDVRETGYYISEGIAKAVEVQDGYAFVANSFCFDVLDISAALSVPNGSIIPHPSSFILYPAYPNPFNSAVTARFALPAPGMVRLDVFDAMGRSVGMLTDKNVWLTGEHKVVWDANGIPSGNYLLQMEAQGYQSSQTISLIR